MPPYFMEGDVQALIDGAGGISMTVGATTAKVLVDEADEELIRDDAAVLVGRVVVIRAKTGTFSGLVEGATVTLDHPVAATSYKVVKQHREGDGAVTRALLAIP